MREILHFLKMRFAENLGWSRMAETYRGMSYQYISRDTIKRRYLEAKESNFKKDQEQVIK